MISVEVAPVGFEEVYLNHSHCTNLMSFDLVLTGVLSDAVKERANMRMTDEQLKSYQSEGFVFLPEYFSGTEVNRMRAELPAIFAEESERKVVEKDGGIVRSVYGSHRMNEVFRRLTQLPRLVEPAMQILESQVYVYQFKINAKLGFGGDLWEWHQDYIFWRNEDGMPTPRVTSVAIFLDEATEFNGPLFLIPRSHREGTIEVSASDGSFSDGGRGTEVYKNSPTWISNLTASLKYSLSKETLARLANKYGMVSSKGPAGSVLFFHGNTVHGSANNISPFDRIVVIVSYNSLENLPRGVKEPRPEFLVSRDVMPVACLPDDALLV